MKRSTYFAALILLGIISIVFSCKKDKNTTANSINVVGNFRITMIQQYQSDSTLKTTNLSSCGASNVCSFKANGGYFESSGCNTDTLKGVYYINGQILSLRDADGNVVDNGLITDYSNTGFKLNEHAVKFSSLLITFERL